MFKTSDKEAFIESQKIEIEGLRIYASPTSLKNNSWSPNSAFQLERGGTRVAEKWEALKEKYKEGDIDILVTHGPPYGFCDR